MRWSSGMVKTHLLMRWWFSSWVWARTSATTTAGTERINLWTRRKHISPSMPFIQPSSPDDHQPNIELSGLSTSMEPLATMATNPSSSFNEQQHSPPTQSIKEMIQSPPPPPPQVFPKRTRTRKTESAEVVTSSPYKAMLVEKRQSGILWRSALFKKRRKMSYGKKKTKKSNKKRRQCDITGSSDEDENWPCLICCEPCSRTRPGDIWVQCQVCHLWAHEECSPGLPQFVCPNCDSDDWVMLSCKIFCAWCSAPISIYSV